MRYNAQVAYQRGKDLKKPAGIGLRPSTSELLKQMRIRWGLSRSEFVERAIIWYAKELDRDPSKLRIPEE